jgi:hypothetical protein
MIHPIAISIFDKTVYEPAAAVLLMPFSGSGTVVHVFRGSARLTEPVPKLKAVVLLIGSTAAR